MVLDPLLETQGVQQLISLGKGIAAWAEQKASQMVQSLSWYQQQYGALMQQYEAIAHLPRQIGSIASSLTSPTLQNPIPNVGSLTGIMSGSALGPTAGLAGQFLGTNTYYRTNSTDPAAQEALQRDNGFAGMQSLATGALQSLQLRAAALPEFRGAIDSSTDIQQTMAINARLSVEQNIATNQQAQASQSCNAGFASAAGERAAGFAA